MGWGWGWRGYGRRVGEDELGNLADGLGERAARRQRGSALDEVDRRIIGVLARDGRAQSTTIGEELGLSGNLVANRIRLKVSGRPPVEVAEELAVREEVLSVHLTSGRFSVSCLHAFRTAREMVEAARLVSAGIAGVEDVDVELINTVYRYSPSVGPLGA